VLTSWGLKREGPVGERERVRLTEGHSLLEAGEEGRRRDTGKKQRHKVPMHGKKVAEQGGHTT